MGKLHILTKVGCTFLLAIITSGECTAIHCGQKEILPLAWPVELPFEKTLPGPVTDYEAMSSNSEFCREYLLDVSRLGPDGFKLECKKGRSGSGHKPWLMARNVKTKRGLAISLAYSGNWRIEISPQGENTLFRAATLPESLKPFKTVSGMPIPGALVAEFTGHWDNGAQPITRFIRAKLLRKLGDDWPWVQYNTWYERPHKKRHLLSEERLFKSVRRAAELGCELFVIDAGWYGQEGESAGWNEVLGDWYVNRERLPNGIEPIAEEVRKLGMKFGMWVEIECAHPSSPVGKTHPQWYLRDGEKLASTRACLDFGNPEALAWAMAEIDRIVSTYQLDYIKMDFGTDLTIDSEKYADQPDPLWRHYRGLVKLWEHMRSNYPDLIIENCSSGSLRHDLLTAAHSDSHWVSDAVRNEDNLVMGFGATYLFPPETCNHWTCYPKSSDVMDIESCFTATMLGQMGLSGPATSWDEKTCRCAAERIALYKQIRPVIRNADVYHLTDQVDRRAMNMIQAVQYLDRQTGRSVLFVFHGGDTAMTTILKLRGLKPDESYHICMPSKFGSERTAKGKELMLNGLYICFPHRGASVVLQIAPSSIE